MWLRAFELLGAKRSMLSGLEKFSKSRITKETKLAKKILKHRRFDYLRMVEGGRGQGTQKKGIKGLRGGRRF
jgi:hypothetical protein